MTAPSSSSVPAYRTFVNVGPFLARCDHDAISMRNRGVSFYCCGRCLSGPPVEVPVGAGTMIQPMICCALPWLGIAAWRLGVGLVAPDAVLAGALHVGTFVFFWLMTACRDPGIVPRGFDRAAWERKFPQLLLTPADAAWRASSSGQQNSDSAVVALNPALHSSGGGSQTPQLAAAASSGSSGVAWAWRECTLCECARPPGTMHCRTCNHCVMGLDHHCSVFGVCIGTRNIHTFRFAIISGYAALAVIISSLPLILIDLLSEFLPLINYEVDHSFRRNALPWLMAVAHACAAVHSVAWIVIMLLFCRLQYFPHALWCCTPWIQRARVLREEEARTHAGTSADGLVAVADAANVPVEEPDVQRGMCCATDAACAKWLLSSDAVDDAAARAAGPCAGFGWLHGLSTVRHWHPREPLIYAPIDPRSGISRRTCAPGLKVGNRFTRSNAGPGGGSSSADRLGHGVWSKVWSLFPSSHVSLIEPHARIPLSEISLRRESGLERNARLNGPLQLRGAQNDDDDGVMLMVDEYSGCFPVREAEIERIRNERAKLSVLIQGNGQAGGGVRKGDYTSTSTTTPLSSPSAVDRDGGVELVVEGNIDAAGRGSKRGSSSTSTTTALDSPVEPVVDGNGHKDGGTRRKGGYSSMLTATPLPSPEMGGRDSEPALAGNGEPSTDASVDDVTFDSFEVVE